MQENTAAEDAQAFGTSPDDPVFATEQAHLSEVYAELEKMRRRTRAQNGSHERRSRAR